MTNENPDIFIRSIGIRPELVPNKPRLSLENMLIAKIPIKPGTYGIAEDGVGVDPPDVAGLASSGWPSTLP